MSPAYVSYQVNGGATPFPGRPFADGPEPNGGATPFTGLPFADGRKPPPYTPYFLSTGIGRDPGPMTVGYGSNALSATFNDTLPREHYTFAFTVLHTNWSVDDDLLAYVCRGLLLLMTPRGMPLPPNRLLIKALPPAGTPPSTTEAL